MRQTDRIGVDLNITAGRLGKLLERKILRLRALLAWCASSARISLASRPLSFVRLLVPPAPKRAEVSSNHLGFQVCSHTERNPQTRNRPCVGGARCNVVAFTGLITI